MEKKNITSLRAEHEQIAKELVVMRIWLDKLERKLRAKKQALDPE